MKLYGKEYSKCELLRKIGNISQVGGMRRYIGYEGWQKDMDCIDVNTGPLQFTLLPSRCLDIAHAQYKSYPFSYMSKSGIRDARYFYEGNSRGYLENFFGGLMSTSGFNNIGSSSTVEDRTYGVHGTLSNTPAQNVSMREFWKDDELFFEICASVYHSSFYAEDILLERRILTKLGDSRIFVTDTVENRDFKKVPVFLLYHINIGFPFVDESARVIMPDTKKARHRTGGNVENIENLCAPIDGKEEECFYCDFDGKYVRVGLHNPSLGNHGMEVYVKYDSTMMPVFTLWKMMRSREYVCGLCPGTNYLEGRCSALENEDVLYLEPLQTATFSVEIGVDELKNPR